MIVLQCEGIKLSIKLLILQEVVQVTPEIQNPKISIPRKFIQDLKKHFFFSHLRGIRGKVQSNTVTQLLHLLSFDPIFTTLLKKLFKDLHEGLAIILISLVNKLKDEELYRLVTIHFVIHPGYESL